MTASQPPASAPELRSAFIARLDNIEVREAREPGDEFTLTGHAAVFDKWSEDLFTFAGTFRERIAPGAFSDVLKKTPDVRLLYNHDGLTLARTKAGTLELSEDDEGLRVWAKLAPTTIATDLRMAMQRGDVDQMSFAFTIAEDEWHEDHDTEEVERTILRVADLFDVSVVSFPAYPDTDAAIRELRGAVAAGKITPPTSTHSGYMTKDQVREAEGFPPVAQPETDAADTKTAPATVQAETDPAAGDERDATAPAETDPAAGGHDVSAEVAETDPLSELKGRSAAARQRNREDKIRLTKEMLK